jgi:ribosomal protein S18 acetylase RimI-like enzyme
MDYRKVTTNDADALAELETELFANNFNEYTIANEIKAGWGFVATEKEEIAGYALLRRAGHITELSRLGVCLKHRREGIGQQLLQLSLLDSPDLVLTVLKSNKAAIELYTKHGLRIVGEVEESWVMRTQPAATYLRQ